MDYKDIDPVIWKVMREFKDRAEKGLKKYKVPMTRTDIDTNGWLQHLKEELMDAVVYIERLQMDFSDGN